MEDYLEFAKKLAADAGSIALKYFGFETETTWKEDNTPLTKADTEINDLIINKISEAYPSHSIYGEEKSLIKKGSKYIWVCDPIDGTVAFSCGLPIFVFSIALVDQSNGLPVLGLINDPVMKNMYWAIKNGGAFRNGKEIFVSKSITLMNSYINSGGTGRTVGFSIFPLMKTLRERKCEILRYPSFIYGAVQVANGKHIAAVFYAKSGHDVAALKIITEEAGGKVTDLNGDERRYDQDGLGCVVSNGYLHNEILECVKLGKL